MTTTSHHRPGTAGRRAVAAVLLAAVLPLAACSDEPADPGPAPAPAEPTETSDPEGTATATSTEEPTEDPAATPEQSVLPSDGASTTG